MDGGNNHSSPVAVTDDFILSNEDILFALENLELSDVNGDLLFLPPHNNNHPLPTFRAGTTTSSGSSSSPTGLGDLDDDNEDLLHVFDNEEFDKYSDGIIGLVGDTDNNHHDAPVVVAHGADDNGFWGPELDPSLLQDLAAQFDSLALDEPANGDFLFAAWEQIVMQGQQQQQPPEQEPPPEPEEDPEDGEADTTIIPAAACCDDPACTTPFHQRRRLRRPRILLPLPEDNTSFDFCQSCGDDEEPPADDSTSAATTTTTPFSDREAFMRAAAMLMEEYENETTNGDNNNNATGSSPPPRGQQPQNPFLLTDDAFNIAAAVLMEEYNAAASENEAFWREQLQVLQNDDNDARYHPADDNDEEEALWDLEPLPLPLNTTTTTTTTTTSHPTAAPDESRRQQEQYSSSVAQQQDDDNNNNNTRTMIANKTPRAAAVAAAQPYLRAFSAPLFGRDEPSSQPPQPPPKMRSRCRECWGHQERILGGAVSPDGTMLATASQDGTVRIWNVSTNQQIQVLKKPTAAGSSSSNNNDTNEEDYEMLRVAWHDDQYLATAGADGWVHIYRVVTNNNDNDDNNNNNNNNNWSLVTSIDHRRYLWPARRQSAMISTTTKTTKTTTTTSSSSAPLAAIPEEEDEELPREEKERDDGELDLGGGPPQIYSLQFIKEWKAVPKSGGEDDDDDKEEHATGAGFESVFLLTSADDFVILWELDNATHHHKKTKIVDGSRSSSSSSRHLSTIQPREIFSLQFTEMSATGYGVSPCHIANGMVNNDPSLGVRDGTILDLTTTTTTLPAFGGNIRNPHNLIYVFDASYCTTNGLIGAALSDGSLRLMNGRGVCLSVLSLPGCHNHAHLTSFSWDSTGQRLVTTVATGHVIVWSIEQQLPGETIVRSCRAVYQGGHIPGRPVFGARYVNRDELLLSWGSDGRLCLWDGQAAEEIDAPLSILLEDEDYPIYGVDVSATTANGNNDVHHDAEKKLMLAIAGGGAIGGFLGVPVFLQDVVGDAGRTADADQAVSQDHTAKQGGT